MRSARRRRPAAEWLHYGGLSLFGLFCGGMAWVVSPALAAWMAPVVLGMAISIPLVALTSARAPGQWLRRHRPAVHAGGNHAAADPAPCPPPARAAGRLSRVRRRA
jgi:uncharacterized membrane protein